ncbi:MAG: hypothetical protein GY815_04755, partial [Gammaproteobacteria bacterium]|nr:hypothetical protein [Gammaproteobacteria bacterium]
MLFLLLITLALLGQAAHSAQLHGFVYARAMVTNEAGNLTWSEYNPGTGAFIKDIGEASGELDPDYWRVMSGSGYRSHVERKNTLHSSELNLLLITRAEYEQYNLLLADGSPMGSYPSLHPGTAYLSILPQSSRLIDDPASLIRDEYPINPDAALGKNILSMLHRYRGDGIGQTKSATSNRIGFKTAFAQDAESGKPVPIDEYARINRGQYNAVSPIEGAILESPFSTRAGSDREGAFTLSWNSVPCPMVPYFHDGIITAQLQYRRFRPKANSFGGRGVYYESRPFAESCIPKTYRVPFIGPMPLYWEITTVPYDAIQFGIDMTVISGTAELRDGVSTSNNRVYPSGGKIAIGDSSQYQAQTIAPANVIGSDYDFDRDGILDTIQLGHIETAANGTEAFVAGDPEEFQGVWLSSSGNTPQTALPDLTRVLDQQSHADHSHQGLLSQISAEDLRNTDIYVVRVADGKLISERIGLKETESKSPSDFGENADDNHFFYTIKMRGSRTVHNRWYANFEDWQSTSGINPALHQKQADHLQPGDAIRIYAINRATGYIGHVDSVLQAAGALGLGDISFAIDPIIMGPPNLKIRIDRGYKIDKGATASNETIHQLVGFEGASLTSDNTVTIASEWLDHQGRPLPEALNGAGYTGRIAILSGDKTFSDSNQGVYQFSIEPGKHLQVLQLPNNSLITEAQHYYVHVSGEPQSGKPIFAGGTDNKRLREADFSSSGQNPGILAKRPDNYVPFLVPVHDEAAS